MIAQKVRMEQNRTTATKVQTINEVGMKPNHMTAKNALARNEVGIEPNHTTEKKAKTTIKNKERHSKKKPNNLKYNFVRVHFQYLKIHKVHSFCFLFDLDQ